MILMDNLHAGGHSDRGGGGGSCQSWYTGIMSVNQWQPSISQLLINHHQSTAIWKLIMDFKINDLNYNVFYAFMDFKINDLH